MAAGGQEAPVALQALLSVAVLLAQAHGRIIWKCSRASGNTASGWTAIRTFSSPSTGGFCRGCFSWWAGFESPVALRQGDDSQEQVPNVPSSQNCCGSTWENVVKADSGEICPEAEVQLHHADTKDSKCCCPQQLVGDYVTGWERQARRLTPTHGARGT